MDNLLKIVPPKTKKSKILLNEYMKADIVPSHPFSILLNGRSKSGKSCVIYNLLSRFYAGYFHEIHLFAGAVDDCYEDLNLNSEHIYNDSDEWPKQLDELLSSQKKDIKKKGVDKAKRVLIIFEDVQNHQIFLRRSKQFKECFIAGRHSNVSVFLTSQSFTATPRLCRLNASAIIYFPGTESELELVAKEFAPPKMTLSNFKRQVRKYTSKRFNFIYINNRAEPEFKYRCNLDTQLCFH